MNTDATSPLFFDRKYRRNADPWNFATSEYEKARYATILRVLNGRRYSRGFEPGCSIGVLSAQLATQCDRLECIDISPAAISMARERCRNLANTTFSCVSVLDFASPGPFDLIVFSEIGYYFNAETLSALAQRLVSRLSSDGVLLAEHWLDASEDHVLSGQRVHEILSNTPALRHQHGEIHPHFQLDRWRRL
jgi:2-polyprenyl-3-methyl-5-hydroxy-6-metoxy-1,4-benzoquinol methylase